MSKPTLEPTPDWIVKQTGFHSIPAGAGFDDNGGIVPVVSPDNDREAFEDSMADIVGLTFEQSAQAAVIHEQFLAVEIHARTGEALRRILSALDGTAAGVALRRVLSGDKTPLRDAAKTAGVSHVAIHLQEKTIKKRLGLTDSV